MYRFLLFLITFFESRGLLNDSAIPYDAGTNSRGLVSVVGKWRNEFFVSSGKD